MGVMAVLGCRSAVRKLTHSKLKMKTEVTEKVFKGSLRWLCSLEVAEKGENHTFFSNLYNSLCVYDIIRKVMYS